jgi:hypothetical protein
VSDCTGKAKSDHLGRFFVTAQAYPTVFYQKITANLYREYKKRSQNCKLKKKHDAQQQVSFLQAFSSLIPSYIDTTF